LVARAGPTANFLLAIQDAIVLNVGLWFGFFEIPDSITFFHVVEGRGALSQGLSSSVFCSHRTFC